MRHESERVGRGTRGSEGKRRQERERGKGVGATGGSGDCRNKAEKGKKGRYYRKRWRHRHPHILIDPIPGEEVDMHG